MIVFNDTVQSVEINYLAHYAAIINLRVEMDSDRKY